jgi:DNA adenine methylase
VKPFLNWPGGKRWLVSGHAHLLSDSGSRLVEPFVGSGAVFFHLEPNAALLSDTNEQLIETFQAVRDQPEAVLAALRCHNRNHGKANYYAVRGRTPRTPALRAARFIYLNRTCFNGIYRVNLKGEFNVPLGSKSALRPDDDFLSWARLLRKAELVAQDFEQCLAETGLGDLIYADPPYTVKHNMNNFVKYNESIFSWEDQVRLAACLSRATERGARVVVSNADSASVRELYPGPGWTRLTLSRSSVLAASSAKRRPTTEIVVSNCLAENGEQTQPRVCASHPVGPMPVPDYHPSAFSTVAAPADDIETLSE